GGRSRCLKNHAAPTTIEQSPALVQGHGLPPSASASRKAACHAHGGRCRWIGRAIVAAWQRACSGHWMPWTICRAPATACWLHGAHERSPPMTDTPIKIKRIAIWICEPCLNGEGQECHTAGCALFLHRVDLPIHPEIYEVLEEAVDA